MSKKVATPFILGGAAGALAIMILSFSMGWIVTSGNANASASEIASEAVKDQLVPICLYQFRNDTDRVGDLEELRALGEWERAGYVTKQGWATMPGSDSPAFGVARECATQLSNVASK